MKIKSIKACSEAMKKVTELRIKKSRKKLKANEHEELIELKYGLEIFLSDKNNLLE